MRIKRNHLQIMPFTHCSAVRNYPYLKKETKTYFIQFACDSFLILVTWSKGVFWSPYHVMHYKFHTTFWSLQKNASYHPCFMFVPFKKASFMHIVFLRACWSPTFRSTNGHDSLTKELLMRQIILNYCSPHRWGAPCCPCNHSTMSIQTYLKMTKYAFILQLTWPWSLGSSHIFQVYTFSTRPIAFHVLTVLSHLNESKCNPGVVTGSVQNILHWKAT